MEAVKKGLTENSKTQGGNTTRKQAVGRLAEDQISKFSCEERLREVEGTGITADLGCRAVLKKGHLCVGGRAKRGHGKVRGGCKAKENGSNMLLIQKAKSLDDDRRWSGGKQQIRHFNKNPSMSGA